MKKYTMLFVCLLVFAGAHAQGDEIHFYLTPSVSQEVLNKNGTFVREFLERETGLLIRMIIPESYDDLIEQFGSSSTCFALMSSQSYIIANQKHGAKVKLRTVRFGHSVYQGMIVTHASSGIKNIRDLEGKTIAYTDELSTSGYLYPKKLLEKNKIKTSSESFVKKHDEVVKLVYERKVDAGAAFYSPPAGNGTLRDARSRLIDKYKDIGSKVIVLVKTDPIPNDPVVFSKNFNAESMQKLSMALIKLTADQKGKQVMLDLYGTDGFVKASDADYNSLRQVMGVLK